MGTLLLVAGALWAIAIAYNTTIRILESRL